MKRNKKWPAVSIKWRIFLGCVLLCMVVLACLWVFQICFLDSFYHGIKVRQIKNGTQEIVRHIDDPNIEDRLKEISQEKQACIVITDESGYVLHSVEGWQDCVVHRMDGILLLRAYYITLENGGTYLEQAQSFQNASHRNDLWANQQLQMYPETMLYTTVTRTSDGSVRFILMNTNLAPVDATVETLRAQLFWVTILMVLLALLLAFILSFTISHPIQKINESAKELAKGKYDTRFSETGYKEIRELAQTLNYAATELSKVEQLQRELIANISHDLRTPLTMITGYAEVMRDLPGENTPENVQVIIDEASRMTTLVNDVLDISKLQSGTIVMNVTVFNLTENIRSMLGRYTKMSDYTITFDCVGDVWVQGDALRISQVVYNLVNNAITYTGPDKRVLLSQKVENGRVRIEIADTGDGIDPSLLNDIWDRYYKVDESHKRAQIGTGLGLSIVKTILDQHPGTSYGVRSQVGQGSVFWFEMEMQSPIKEDIE